MAHVRFGYLPDKTVIHDLNLRAEPGNLVAIVGPTGAGKNHHHQSPHAFLRSRRRMPSASTAMRYGR